MKQVLHSRATPWIMLIVVQLLILLPGVWAGETPVARPVAAAAEGVAPEQPSAKEAKARRPQAAAAYEVQRDPGKNQEIVTRTVIHLLQTRHFNSPVLNDASSRELFDEYFAALDPERLYFIAADIQEFSPYRLILDDMLIGGKLDFAFVVYERFLERVSQRVEGVRRLLKDAEAKPFDFTKDEEMLLDRSQKPWTRDHAELLGIWRQRLKNELLVEKLLREAGEKADGGGALKAPLPPREKVLRSYANHHELLQNRDTCDVMEGLLTTLTTLFDPHSSYLNWRSLEDFNIDMSLELEGIGAVLTPEDGYVKVVRLVPGGPAIKDGRLQPGELIVAVGQGDGEAVHILNLPLSKVVRLIRGKKGTKVCLTVIKLIDEKSKQVKITLTRAKVELREAAARGRVHTVKRADGSRTKIGYIYLRSFYADWRGLQKKDPKARSTTKDVRELVNKMLKDDRIKGLIIDLRGNGGGSLEESISLTGLFIPGGPVVQVKHSQGRPVVRKDPDRGFAYDLPLAVMTDHGSASASEIFAGAIQDYGRGVIIGDKQTHGKGTVQTVQRLANFPNMHKLKPGALKYTMAKFYRVTGHSTQLKGIRPDIILPSFFDHMEIGESRFKHVMPWDEISPQRINSSHGNITRYLPRLKAGTAKRLAGSEEYQKLFAEIKNYEHRRRQKTLTLNKQKRLTLRRQDKHWAKRIAAVHYRAGRENKDEKSKDLYLEEAWNVLADLVELVNADRGAK